MKYDALGNRVVKENPKRKVKEVYVRDAQGNILALYQVNNDSLYTKEFYMYGSQRLGYLEDDVFMGKKCIGKFCNITANPINPMPFIGTQKTLPTLPPVVIQPIVSSSVSIVFGKKRYELSDWLGNVRVVINDRKTPVNIGTTTVGYKAQVINVNDYYSFGSEIDERTYTYNTPYRFSFNGKEDIRDQRWYQDYGARWYNKVLGRFISPDPLIIGQKKYAWLSGYQFASNRPIDGIDMDGLEYLNSNESRIEIVGGEVKLKISNFLWPNRVAFENANNDPRNWRPGEIGINTTIGYVGVNNTVIKDANPSLMFLNNNLAKGNVNADYPDRAPSVSPTYDDTNPTVVAPGGSRSAARAVGIVNLVNFGLEQIGVWSAFYDIIKSKEHEDILRNKVMRDINEALKGGMIPERYQNQNDIGAIMNVILQGENKTDNPEIYKIGMKIYNTISNPNNTSNNPPFYKKEAAPADNTRVAKPKNEKK
jgi:RHS repeat-associated protein